MSIIQYSNRNKYKNKAAIELIFHKSCNYKLPPGYRSIDVCLVGGGSSGEHNLIHDDGQSLGSSGSTIYLRSGRGGSGGFVINKYGIEIPNGLEIYVNIGKGGKWPGYSNYPDVYATTDSELRKDSIGYIYRYYFFTSKVDERFGKGEDTYIKNIKDNLLIAKALGGQGWRRTEYYWGSVPLNYKQRYKPNRSNEIINCGGGNNGGDPGYYGNHSGYNGGYPILNPKVSGFNPYTFLIRSIAGGYSTMPQHEIWYRQYYYNCGNLSYDNIDMGATRIFKDGDFVAGGGCASNLDTILDIPVGSKTGDYHNDSGGGESGIAICEHNQFGSYRYRLDRKPGNGAPNTGGGGAGGLTYSTTNYSSNPGRDEILALPGDGGDGLCVIRAYPDDKRPNIKFTNGINSYIIE